MLQFGWTRTLGAMRRGQSEEPCRHCGSPLAESWADPVGRQGCEERWGSSSSWWAGSLEGSWWSEDREEPWWQPLGSGRSGWGIDTGKRSGKGKAWDEPDWDSWSEGGRSDGIRSRSGRSEGAHSEAESIGRSEGGRSEERTEHSDASTQVHTFWKKLARPGKGALEQGIVGGQVSFGNRVLGPPKSSEQLAEGAAGSAGHGCIRATSSATPLGEPRHPAGLGRAPAVASALRASSSSGSKQGLHLKGGEVDPTEAAQRLRKLEALRQKRAEEAKRVSDEHTMEVKKMLMPVSSEPFVQLAASAHHPGTCSWLFEEVDKWWLQSESRLLVLEGGAAVGKTTFLGALCTSRAEIVKASFFCRHDCDLRCDARWLVRSFSAQLACKSPKICHHLLQSGITSEELEEMTARAMLPELLTKPLEIVAGDLPSKFALVIDGVDEGKCSSAPTVHSIQRLLELCFHDLPARAVFIVSSRPGTLWESTAARLKPHVIAMDTDRRHQEDIELFAREAVLPGLVAQGPELAATAVALCRRVRGHFLHAALARAILARWTSDRQRLTAAMVEGLLPDTASGSLGAYFGPLLCSPEHGDGLTAAARSLLLAAAVAPTPLPAGRGAAELVEGCPAAAVPVSAAAIAAVFPVAAGGFVAVHRAVTEWFLAEERPAEVKAALRGAHAALARRCLPLLASICEAQRLCAPVPEGGPKESAWRYAVKHGLAHAWAAGELLPEELRLQAQEFVFDARYIRAKCHFFPQEYEAQEQTRAAQCLPGLARPLRLLRSALFVSMEAVRQLPKVHVAEQVWDRTQKAVATRCVGTQPPDFPTSQMLSRLLESVRERCGRGEDSGCFLTLEPLMGAFGEGCVAMLTGHTQWIMVLATYRTEAGDLRLASGGGEHTIRIWADMEEGLPALRTLEGHSDHVRALTTYCLSDGRRRLASGSSDNTVRIWDPESDDEAIQVLHGHTDWVRGLTAFLAGDGTPRLASGSSDGSIRVWTVDGDNFSEVRALEGHERMVMKLASYSVGGVARIVSGAADRTIRIWDPEQERPALRVMNTHRHWVTALEAFKGDDGELRLASGCADGTILIWHPEVGGVPLQHCEGHTDWVCELAAFIGSHGSQLLASASADRTLRVWDPSRGGTSLAMLEGHGHWVRGLVAFHSTSGVPCLASGSDDRTIRIWCV